MDAERFSTKCTPQAFSSNCTYVPRYEQPTRQSARMSIQNAHICLITIQDV